MAEYRQNQANKAAFTVSETRPALQGLYTPPNSVFSQNCQSAKSGKSDMFSRISGG